MADATSQPPRRALPRIDKAWAACLLIPLALLAFDQAAVPPVLTKAATSLASTAPFILFATLAVALLKATGAESLLARAFEGRQSRMILMAALLGGLSPFCSCEVIPFIAALLAVGAPLSAVMAFWLASPLMDPAMFLITAGAISTEFALAKTLFAVAIGASGGFATMAFARTAVFADPLREKPQVGGCCGASQPFKGAPRWRFWSEPSRRATFSATFWENLLFLGKWLTLAYLIEGLMIRYVPADAIGTLLGGTGLDTIALSAILGAPAYLNGYAAAPLVGSLMEQGMSAGAGMAFMIAGGISSIPAALAVWALVKPRVFAAYLGYALAGSFLAGSLWQMVG